MSSYKPLLDLAKLINEPIESFDGEKIYYATGDINENSETEITKVTFRDKPSRANLTSKQGDVIFARMQATKKVRITSKDDEESIFSTGFAILRPSKFLDSRFLFHYLNSDIFQKAKDRLCSGSTQKAINNQKLAEIDIPYFDVSTQQKIAAILDKADSLRQKDKQLLRLFENLIDSVFNERFKNESNLVPLSDLCTKITDGVHARPVYTETGIPFISVKNVTTKKLEFKNCQFISEKDHQNFVKRCNPELDDILYTKVGATYGRAAIVNTKCEFSLYVSVALLKPKKEIVNSTYLFEVLNTSFIKRQADRSVKGAGVPDLHLIEIKNFKIPVPTLERQSEFASIALKIEKQIEQVRNQIGYSESLFQSLLQQAFKGELVKNSSYQNSNTHGIKLI